MAAWDASKHGRAGEVVARLCSSLLVVLLFLFSFFFVLDLGTLFCVWAGLGGRLVKMGLVGGYVYPGAKQKDLWFIFVRVGTVDTRERNATLGRGLENSDQCRGPSMHESCELG
jgi:hypothetical protein